MVCMEPLDSRSKIFQDPHEAICWLVDENLLKTTMECTKCPGIMILTPDDSYMNCHRFKCRGKTGCGTSIGVFDKTSFSNPRIPIHNYLYILYSFAEKQSTLNLNKNSRVSASSVFGAKKKNIRSTEKRKSQTPKKIMDLKK
ncbi:DDE-TNP-IS1595 domain-containing protein [Vairimorpha necatrix]|uniref:DDE-TNP-IS1595 domain-containing protein n=1 Tax=Vairimorpha necatrix TaxID=6039 RepID=A0AAX4JFG2_9MICR